MSSNEAFSDHKKFSIGHLAQLTGVLPVTLRAWERRYGLIAPERTPKGHRLYSDADVQQVLRILRLIEHGIPVGQVRRALLGTQDAVATTSDWPDFRQQLMLALQSLSSPQVLAVLRWAGELYPLASLAVDLIQPTLNRLQQSPLSSNWAWQELLRHTLALYLNQRSQSVTVSEHAAPVLMCSCLSAQAADAIHARMFELCCREAGLDVRWLGHAPSPLAFAELLHKHDNSGGVVWQESEPLDDWMTGLMALARVAGVPLAIGGAFARQHNERLSSMSYAVLPQESSPAVAIVRTWLRPLDV